LINPDGTGLTSLPLPGAVQDWSPDGKRLLLRSSSGLLSTNLDGSAVQQVTTDARDNWPSWSPDGRKIVFTRGRQSDPSGPPTVFVVNADGSAPTPVTNGRAGDWQPVLQNYVRPKGATPIMVSLVPAFKECTATNGSHPAPWAFSSCTPSEHMSDYLTVGTPDVPGNGQPAKFSGTVRFDVCPVPGCAAPNVKLYANLTDVRKKDLSDYGGELQASIKLRLTDRPNGATGTDGATVQDFPLTFAVPCTATTTDTTVGSTCSVDTTQNSLVPGSVQSGKRAVWKLGEIDVYDGGADGDADTPGNTLFAWQGLFIP
jgi:hypothetical protein